MTTTEHLRIIEQRLHWLSHWMIHNANNLRPKADGIKVGGHQASSASMVSIMTALYFSALRPEDRVAVKPHASPIFHAIQYLMGQQTREKMENFRGYGGVQSYPSRTKDIDDVDFSTGSVGLGVAITSFASLVQDYINAKPWSPDRPPGRMIALVGDAELDEGNVYEALQEGWKNNLRNCWWIIDYNRQNLDGTRIPNERGLEATDAERIEKTALANGWKVIQVRHGKLREEIFAKKGGDAVREVLERGLTDYEFQMLALKRDAGATRELFAAKHPGTKAPMKALDDETVLRLLLDLGGHCYDTIRDALLTDSARESEGTRDTVRDLVARFRDSEIKALPIPPWTVQSI